MSPSKQMLNAAPLWHSSYCMWVRVKAADVNREDFGKGRMKN